MLTMRFYGIYRSAKILNMSVGTILRQQEYSWMLKIGYFIDMGTRKYANQPENNVVGAASGGRRSR